uniref:Protein DPCD n=1 Tax=Corethron hystrix TaxID=216773 RepID=A0A7S1BPI3_9STRA|mmetsp:Transcript_34536/g.79849  ORF Transcript_34536/g.79849 Transcript_34536/m.79849 type:complete len:203 (+) Transcript_34536:106-714(+)
MYKNYKLGEGKSTVVPVDGKLRVITLYPDETEKLEVWKQNLTVPELLLRKWRTHKQINLVQQSPSWEIEVGNCAPHMQKTKMATTLEGRTAPDRYHRCGELIVESTTTANPTCAYLWSPFLLVFQVRNCPWPFETYRITMTSTSLEMGKARNNKRQGLGEEVILRTTNRKYFKVRVEKKTVFYFTLNFCLAAVMILRHLACC